MLQQKLSDKCDQKIAEEEKESELYSPLDRSFDQAGWLDFQQEDSFLLDDQFLYEGFRTPPVLRT